MDPAWLVVSQGFDTFAGDRWGGFELHAPDYAAIGERLRSFGRPLVIILEGGYETSCLADGSLALLDGLDPE
jgi:acetoin utilization deacetylase AcuC-like enzyme